MIKNWRRRRNGNEARPKVGVAELHLGSCLNAILNLLLNLEANGLWYIRPHGSLCVVLCCRWSAGEAHTSYLSSSLNAVLQSH